MSNQPQNRLMISKQLHDRQHEGIHQPVLIQFLTRAMLHYCQLRGGRSNTEYNPFICPPSLAAGVKHYRASLVGPAHTRPDSHLCPCCARLIYKQKIPLTCHYTELGFLSVPLALYFHVLKLALAFLAMVLLPALVVCFLDLQVGEEWQLGEVLWVRERTLARQLLLFQAVLSALGLSFISRNCSRAVSLIEMAAPLPQTFAVKLTNLPPCTEEQLKIWVFNKFGEYPCAVNLTYDTKKLNESYTRREKMTIELNRLIQAKLQPQHHSPALLEGTDRVKTDLKERIEQQDENLNKYRGCSIIPSDIFIGVAFVVLARTEKVKEILKERQQGQFCLRKSTCPKPKYKESQIEVAAAPNPRDIIWSNLKEGQYKVLLTYSVLFVGVNWLLGPVFISIVQFFAELCPEQLLVVCLLSYLLYHLLVHLFVTFFLDKLECSTFTRRALISFYSYGVFNVLFLVAMPYHLNLPQQKVVPFIYILLLVDALTHSAIKIFNVSNVMSRIYCQYIIHMPVGSNPYTQGYFNRLMEGWEFKIGENYHYLFRGLCLCAFFARPAPLAAVFYIISFSVQFWVQKYILLRKCKTPPKVSQVLSNHFLALLHALPLIYLLGAYTFHLHYHQEDAMVEYWELVVAFVCCLSIVIISHCLNEGDLKEDEEGSQQGWGQMESQLSQFYEVENEIGNFNWELRQRARERVLRHPKQEQLELNDEDFFVEEQEMQSEKVIEKHHHSLVHRLISYNNEMYPFPVPSHSPSSIN